MTIFRTPVIQHLLRFAGHIYLKLTGWKCVGVVPPDPKYIIVGAPHTSNWDFIKMLACAPVLRLNPYWMGKHTLFQFPLKTLAKWLGGIPIDRTKPHSVVDQTVEVFNNTDELCIIIAPEGTRSRCENFDDMQCLKTVCQGLLDL